MAPDGVLVFRARQGEDGSPVPALDTLPYVTLDVSNDQGAPVTGTFAYADDFDALIWRPDAPLAASTDYTVTLTVDNEAIATELADGFQECAENIAGQWTVSTSAQPLQPPATPGFEPLAELDAHVGLDELGALVCCDGAMPREEFSCVPEDSVFWTEGYCEGTREYRQLRLTYDIDWGTLAPERAANLAVAIVSDGGTTAFGPPGATSLRLTSSEPVCVTVEAHDLATGQVVMSRPACFGDDLLPLGWVDSDPSASLAQNCSGQPYVCEVQDGQWNPDRCEPWGDDPDTTGGSSSGSGGDDDGTSGGGTSHGSGDGGTDGGDDAGQDGGGVADRGCACSATSNGGPRWLWLLPVAALVRRRHKARVGGAATQ
jgi:MYXO-CTERM domain-containing protein